MTAARRRILFLTGTRADFGKMLPLMRAVDGRPDWDCRVFVTGMHTLQLYGYTVVEVRNAGLTNVHVFANQVLDEPMEQACANTIAGLSRFVHELPPDMIVVHGDRVEAMAGAIVGALRNMLVAHVEGGELSGTIDGSIRHAVSKLAHLHLVANEEAATRLRQMGEAPDGIFVIGSPDLDVMASPQLPELDDVRRRYGIGFDDYAVATFHPVTTEPDDLRDNARQFVDALLRSGRDHVVIYPNNDEGARLILDEYRRLAGNPRFRVFPSIRFEYFLTLLRHMRYIVGNSSAGIREAPFYGRPSVNVGTRQDRRSAHPAIVNTGYGADDILAGIERALAMAPTPSSHHFGDGGSQARFLAFLDDEAVWRTPKQKTFVDLNHLRPAAS